MTIKTSHVAWILCAGAVGGVVSGIDSWTSTLAIASFGNAAFNVFLVPALKGCVAAGVGVFLLSTFNAEEMVRAFFFAMTCGLSFPVVLANGQAYTAKVTQTVASAAVANARAQVGAAALAAAAASAPAAAASSISVLQKVAIDAIQVVARAPAEEAKTVDAVAAQAISAIARGPLAASEPAAAKAISDIGVAAAIQSLPTSRRLAISELEKIQVKNGADPATAMEARLAIDRINGAMAR